jgi:hypothetical protein
VGDFLAGEHRVISDECGAASWPKARAGRGYWVPFAVTVILKPDDSTLLGRGAGRLIGTLFGATLAAVLVSELHPDLLLTTVFVALTAWAAYPTWTASFSVSIGFVTALVLILLSTSLTDTVAGRYRRPQCRVSVAVAGKQALMWTLSAQVNGRARR